MKQNIIDKTCCKHCGSIRDDNDSGPCPSCGKTGRIISASVEDSIKLSGSLGYKHTREHYEKNRSSQIIVLLISIFSPLVGLFLAGVPGVLIGFIFSFLNYFFGAKAIIKVREITRGGDL